MAAETFIGLSEFSIVLEISPEQNDEEEVCCVYFSTQLFQCKLSLCNFLQFTEYSIFQVLVSFHGRAKS